MEGRDATRRLINSVQDEIHDLFIIKHLQGKVDNDIDRVQVTDILPDRKGPLMKYEPNHPDANAEGYVAYPDINMMQEMVDMLQASRSYEANVSAMNTTKNIALSAIEIGR